MSNILIVGNGGREFALCWKLSQSELVKSIFVWPKCSSFVSITKTQTITIDEQELINWSKNNEIDLVVIGPEIYLEKGLVDDFQENNILCFGPKRSVAKIETCKFWAKNFMDRHGIPTANWKSFSDANRAKNFILNETKRNKFVVKFSGLAAGKGVVVAKSIAEALQAVDSIFNKFMNNTQSVVIIEEFLTGEELSVLGFSDGHTIKLMPTTQDHKRLLENDLGPNTGGMGAYCPCDNLLNDQERHFIEQNIMQKTIDRLRSESLSLVGVLYAGLMMTETGPKVLEFNCRFGDPETEVILPLLQSDLYEILHSCCVSRLSGCSIKWKENQHVVGIVMASSGYPEYSTKHIEIPNIHKYDCNYYDSSVQIFHSATYLDDSGKYYTNGGRVLCAVSMQNSLLEASVGALDACGKVLFDGARFRRDIARNGILREIVNRGRLSYKEAGVDINSCDRFIAMIKNAVKSTYNSAVLGQIGAFGSLYDIKGFAYDDPVLVSGSDGVGTKLKIAQICRNYKTIGVDLVAMCVNDIIAQGARPLYFLDYYACGRLSIANAKEIIDGIIEGCKKANCALIGGETAEMPGLYKNDDFDLAGFATGIVSKRDILPNICSDDAIDHTELCVIGLASSGLHSNGFSLVRKVMTKASLDYDKVAPFSVQKRTYGEEFLVPTRIYVCKVIDLMEKKKIRAFAHITGGGLIDNIPRILPPNKKAVLDANLWTIPPVFPWLAIVGEINSVELLRTFNCGIGAVVVVNRKDKDFVIDYLESYSAKLIGTIENRSQNENQVEIKDFDRNLMTGMKEFFSILVTIRQIKKRIAVLISGKGTNLQALITACRNAEQNIRGEIVLVISSKSSAAGLKIAKNAGIKTEVIDPKKFKSRIDFDLAIEKILGVWNIEIVCLAGFEYILGSEFVAKWPKRIINIHPSLLPSFKGLKAQKQALEAGVKVTGCTVHFVDEELDHGEIILQSALDILENDTEESLTERIKKMEHECYPKALKHVIQSMN